MFLAACDVFFPSTAMLSKKLSRRHSHFSSVAKYKPIRPILNEIFQPTVHLRHCAYRLWNYIVSDVGMEFVLFCRTFAWNHSPHTCSPITNDFVLRALKNLPERTKPASPGLVVIPAHSIKTHLMLSNLKKISLQGTSTPLCISDLKLYSVTDVLMVFVLFCRKFAWNHFPHHLLPDAVLRALQNLPDRTNVQTRINSTSLGLAEILIWCYQIFKQSP